MMKAKAAEKSGAQAGLTSDGNVIKKKTLRGAGKSKAGGENFLRAGGADEDEKGVDIEEMAIEDIPEAKVFEISDRIRNYLW